MPLVFDELDYELACQAYLWALPLVSYAQCQNQHRQVFGATEDDLVRYVTYRDRLGLITANATTPYILNFIDLSVTGPLLIELPAGPTAGGASDFWQREFAIMGEMGPDRGAGGRHLIVVNPVPPDGSRPSATADQAELLSPIHRTGAADGPRGAQARSTAVERGFHWAGARSARRRPSGCSG